MSWCIAAFLAFLATGFCWWETETVRCSHWSWRQAYHRAVCSAQLFLLMTVLPSTLQTQLWSLLTTPRWWVSYLTMMRSTTGRRSITWHWCSNNNLLNTHTVGGHCGLQEAQEHKTHSLLIQGEVECVENTKFLGLHITSELQCRKLN